MILSAQQIYEAVLEKDIQIDPFDEDQLKPVSYTLRLGYRFWRHPENTMIDLGNQLETKQETLLEGGSMILSPGEFIVGETFERVTLSDTIAGTLSVRGSCAQAGLNALNSDLVVEPGSSGPLKLAIKNTNHAPIKIIPGMNIVKILFYRLEDKPRL